MRLKFKAMAIATVTFGLASVLANAAEKKQPATPAVLFDDFSYADASALSTNGWIIRDKVGYPGVEGAKWGAESLAFLDDPEKKNNRLIRMMARTDGTAGGTRQAQFCHARKYLEGTYAARVRFTDEPVSGPDGDAIVQTFYTISPLRHAFDPDYSELDWEYLPNGGWGEARGRMYATSWQTVQIEPWSAHRAHHEDFRSFNGWHTLVIQVSDGRIRYYMDGKPFVMHDKRVYPVVPMSVNFNLWFVNQGTLPNNSTPREYHQDVDWVFHAKDKVLSPKQVDAAVRKLRTSGAKHVDTVPAAEPPLPSNCDF